MTANAYPSVTLTSLEVDTLKIVSAPFQKSLAILLLVPALLLCAGCGKKDKTQESAPPAPSSEGPDQTIKFKDDKGQEMTIDVGRNKGRALPKGFPDDFPICAHTGVTSQVISVPDSTMFTLSFNASDSAEDVAAFYEKALPEKGYDVKATMSMDDATHFVIEKGEKIAGNVVIAQEDAQVVVSVTLQVQK